MGASTTVYKRLTDYYRNVSSDIMVRDGPESTFIDKRTPSIITSVVIGGE